MNFVDSLCQKITKRGMSSLPGPTDDFWYQTIRQSGSTGGQPVNPQTAERIAAVYACKTAICESIAMLPAAIYDESDSKNKKKLDQHPLFQLIRHQPNGLMDSFSFFEAMQNSLLDSGNAYAQILRKRSGAIDSLMPLDSTRVSVKVGEGKAGPEYIYHYDEPGGGRKSFSSREMLHIRYRTKDGLVGRSPIEVAAESFGFNLALLEHGNAVFENGAFLSGLLQAGHRFKDDEDRKRFMDSFKKFMGASASGKFALLEQGVEYKPFQQTSRDAQFLELSEFSVVQIARIFRIPPVMIQAMDKGMSYASIEQLAMFFTQYTVQPWVTRWERAIKTQLLNTETDTNAYVRFNISALIRGDLKSRTEAIVQQLQYGLVTINEARSILDSNAIEHPLGDEPMVSHNLIPISRLEDRQEGPEIEPEEEPEDSQEENPVEDTPQEPNKGPEPADSEISPLGQTKSTSKQENPSRERFEPLFESLLGRAVRKELAARDRAAKSPGFVKWGESFLFKHQDFLKGILAPAVQAYGGTDEQLTRFIGSYFEQRSKELITKADQAWAEPEQEEIARQKDILFEILDEEKQ